jgi:hypothetical protein
MTEPGDKAPQALLRWAAPLTSMMPLFSVLDDLQAQADMANIARLSGSDPGGATQSAKTKSHLYISQGRSTIEHTWLQPALRRKGLQHVLFTAEDHGLVVPSWLRETPDANALNKAVEQEDWQKRLSQPVPVRRVWVRRDSCGRYCSTDSRLSFLFSSVRAANGLFPARPASASAVPTIAANVSMLDEPSTSVALGQAVNRRFKCHRAESLLF